MKMKRFILFLILLTASVYGQQWQITSVEPSYVSSFCVAGNGDVFAGGAPGEFYRYSNQDFSWIKLNTIDLQYKAVFENRAGDLIALPTSWEGGEIVKISTDFGNSWTDGESILSGSHSAYGDTLISGSYISSDGGFTWKRSTDKNRQDLAGRFISSNNRIFYISIDANQDYNYFLYSLEDSSLTPISNYAFKRPANYNTEYVNTNVPDSILLPFSPKYGYYFNNTFDADGNLVLYNREKVIVRYKNDKWEIINYSKGKDDPSIPTAFQFSINYAVGDSEIYKLNYDSTFSLKLLSGKMYTGIQNSYNGNFLYRDNCLYIKGIGIINKPGDFIFQKYDLLRNEYVNILKGIPGQIVLNMQKNINGTYAQTSVGYIYKSFDGLHWEKLQTRSYGKSLFLDSLIITGSDADGGPSYISSDGGATWNRFISELTPKGISVFDIYSDGQDIIFSNYRAFSDREIVISRDKGHTWEILLRPSQFANKVYTANNEFLASTYDPYVYIATDSARIDTTTPPAYVNSFASVGSAYFGGTEQGIVKLERTQVSGNRMFKSNANPEWTFTGLQGKKILSLTSDSLGVVYAGTEDGTYFSADSGATWEVYGTVVSGNLKKTAISGLSQVKALLVNGSELFAAASEGLYKTKTYGAIGINEEPNITITGYELKQNYPNPFNPATNISFTLPKAARVKLTVYNALGQEVGQLVNMELGQGSYNYRLDGSRLASGIYIYSLEAGTFRTAKKMMLIK